MSKQVGQQVSIRVRIFVTIIYNILSSMNPTQAWGLGVYVLDMVHAFQGGGEAHI